MLIIVPTVFINAKRLSCFSLVLVPRITGDYQETHGKEELTKRQRVKTFSNSVKVTSQARKKRIACESSDAVHTLRPPRNVGAGCTFEAFALFTNHRVWGNPNIHNMMNCKKDHIM